MSQFRYPNSKRIFTLDRVDGFVYHFKCGHWCTDSVFEDLINIKTGLAKWQIPTLFNQS